MEPTQEIKYYNDDKQQGIIYDWKLIAKEFKSLGIPKDVHTPPINVFSRDFSIKYIVENSERSIGKTTNWLLLGMVMHKLYGTTIEYIRQIVDMIMPKNMKLFRTILEYDYIEQLTDGRFNSVKYASRSFYYWNTETGDIDDEAFMHVLSIDNNQDYKSSYNAPRGDLVIFDEFISKYYRPNEFVDFEDLVKTIIRDRISPIIVMLANTIDKFNIYFKELEIYDDIQLMSVPDQRVCTSQAGTKVLVNLIKGKKEAKQKKIHNKLFFGFKNKRLNAIRGGDWAISSYPHIPRYAAEDIEILSKDYYIDFNGKYLNIEIARTENIGLVCHVHECTRIPEKKSIVIYTDTETITSVNQRYLLGDGTLDKLIWGLYRKNKFYYADNTIGEMVFTYYKNAKLMSR